MTEQKNLPHVEKTRLSDDVYLLGFEMPGAIQFRAGQFAMLRATHSLDPFLRRPLAIFRQENHIVYFLMQVKGKGTKQLSSMQPGDTTDILLPLGNGFPDTEGDCLILAGGMGIAPVFSLLLSTEKPTLIYGARTESELFALDIIRETNSEFIISTDDGSTGEKGDVISVFSRLFPDFHGNILACGPDAMISSLRRATEGKNVRAFVSLEARMACGVGACSGCAIRTKNGMKRVCRDGPVFDIAELIM